MSATLGEAHDDLYRSLNVMLEGDAGPVLAVWSSSDDVTYGAPSAGSCRAGKPWLRPLRHRQRWGSAAPSRCPMSTCSRALTSATPCASSTATITRSMVSRSTWSTEPPTSSARKAAVGGTCTITPTARLRSQNSFARHGRDVCTVTQVSSDVYGRWSMSHPCRNCFAGWDSPSMAWSCAFSFAVRFDCPTLWRKRT